MHCVNSMAEIIHGLSQMTIFSTNEAISKTFMRDTVSSETYSGSWLSLQEICCLDILENAAGYPNVTSICQVKGQFHQHNSGWSGHIFDWNNYCTVVLYFSSRSVQYDFWEERFALDFRLTKCNLIYVNLYWTYFGFSLAKYFRDILLWKMRYWVR